MRPTRLIPLALWGWIISLSPVNAQAAVFGVSTSIKPSTCTPVNITWQGGTPPFTPRINKGDLRQLLPEVNERKTSWLPEEAEDITITILDSAGRQSTSETISITSDCITSTQSSTRTRTEPTSSPTTSVIPSDQNTSRDPGALIIGLATGMSILFTLSLFTLFIICRRRHRRDAKKLGWAIFRPGTKTPNWEDVSLPVDLESRGPDSSKIESDGGQRRGESWGSGDKPPLRINPPLPAPYHTRLDSAASMGDVLRQTPQSSIRPLGSSADSSGTGRRTLRFIPPAAPPPSPSPTWQEPPSPTGSFGTNRSSILIHDRDSGLWSFDRNPFLTPGGRNSRDLGTQLSDLLLRETQRVTRASPDTAEHPPL